MIDGTSLGKNPFFYRFFFLNFSYHHCSTLCLLFCIRDNRYETSLASMSEHEEMDTMFSHDMSHFVTTVKSCDEIETCQPCSTLHESNGNQVVKTSLKPVNTLVLFTYIYCGSPEIRLTLCKKHSLG